MFRNILKSKFLVYGLVIGFISVNAARMFTSKNQIWAHNRLPVWMFILPPIAFYAVYKAFFYKPKK